MNQFSPSIKKLQTTHSGRHCLVASLCSAFAIFGQLGAAETGLDQIATLRGASAEALNRAVEVRIRGVVTYADPLEYQAIFVQDASAGIYVEPVAAPEVERGDEVEVEGELQRGQFAPMIRAHSWRKLGHAQELPAPKACHDADLLKGREDSQWVELRGVVRAVAPYPGDRSELDIVVDGNRLKAVTSRHPLGKRDLVDSEVRLRGVVYSRFVNGRWLGASLGITDDSDVVVERPAAADPFACPEKSVGELLRFDPGRAFAHRVRVQGTISLAFNERRLFLRDAGQPLEVALAAPLALIAGDRVEVAGFPQSGSFHALLEDAVVRRIGSGAPIQPQRPELKSILLGVASGELVTIRAALVDQMQDVDGRVVTLEMEHCIFRAHLPPAETSALPFQPGSMLDLTGVCVTPLPGDWQPTRAVSASSFQLWTRSPTDIVLVAAPPWWTERRVMTVLFLLAGLLFAMALWVVTLHWKVKQQTVLIQARVQHQMLLEERNRIARDLHDTVTQSLAAVAMQLDAFVRKARSLPPSWQEELRGILQSIRHGVAEARRSVMNLRALGLQRNNLLAAIKETTRSLARQASASSQPKLDYIQTGAVRSTPPRVEHQLLRIAQEAVANAIQHASAQTIRVTLRYEDQHVALVVADDGKGFDLDASSAAPPGHFGLKGLRERAMQLGAEFQLHSAPGEGTKVEVRAPLDGQLSSKEALPTSNALP